MSSLYGGPPPAFQDPIQRRSSLGCGATADGDKAPSEDAGCCPLLPRRNGGLNGGVSSNDGRMRRRRGEQRRRPLRTIADSTDGVGEDEPLDDGEPRLEGEVADAPKASILIKV